MDLLPGTRLRQGRYEVGPSLGQGSFGITYKGLWHETISGSLGGRLTSTPVAIKEFFFADYCTREGNTSQIRFTSATGREDFSKFRQKLVKEGHILSSFRHPNIVKVYDIFEENNTVYLVMDLIDGETLRDKMGEKGKLPEALVLKYIGQIGEALREVHAKKVLHLDIKPTNILVERNTDRAMLIDFGISKRYDSSNRETSFTERFLGSPGYAPLEQYQSDGLKKFTPQTDIYALGATMYHCMTGVKPEEAMVYVDKKLVSPAKLNPRISEATETMIRKAMSLRIADRFSTVEEMFGGISKRDLISGDEIRKSKKNQGVKDEKTSILSKNDKGESSKSEKPLVLNINGFSEDLRKSLVELVNTFIKAQTDFKTVFVLLGGSVAIIGGIEFGLFKWAGNTDNETIKIIFGFSIPLSLIGVLYLMYEIIKDFNRTKALSKSIRLIRAGWVVTGFHGEKKARSSHTRGDYFDEYIVLQFRYPVTGSETTKTIFLQSLSVDDALLQLKNVFQARSPDQENTKTL